MSANPSSSSLAILDAKNVFQQATVDWLGTRAHKKGTSYRNLTKWCSFDIIFHLNNCVFHALNIADEFYQSLKMSMCVCVCVCVSGSGWMHVCVCKRERVCV